MRDTLTLHGTSQEAIDIPEYLTNLSRSCTTVHIDPGNACLSEHVEAVAVSLCSALDMVHPDPVSGQVLLKTHIGEMRCATHMRPEYAEGCNLFLKDRGVTDVAAGDTTVAYTGPRGAKQNPAEDVSIYLRLAELHGWSAEGPAGIPFVVLDRPVSAVEDRFEFFLEERTAVVDGVRRYRDFHRAGGFSHAGFVLNNAHLTLHGLAGIAGCIKSIAMGCCGMRGKLTMHQSLLPMFDPQKCSACGICVDNCPTDALIITSEKTTPFLDPDRCIGCGECEALCSRGAARLAEKGITDWLRGVDTLPFRMTDYAVGLLNGKWQNTVHILHMYSVTEGCDCIDIRQFPMFEKDLGFLVGKNPFAIDRLAGELLSDALERSGKHVSESLLTTADLSADYAYQTYGILPETPLETIELGRYY